jgi:hypothetical protein
VALVSVQSVREDNTIVSVYRARAGTRFEIRPSATSP